MVIPADLPHHTGPVESPKADGVSADPNDRLRGPRNLFNGFMARETATNDEFQATQVRNEQINNLPLAEEDKQTLTSSLILKGSMQGQLIYFLRQGRTLDDEAIHMAAINVLGLPLPSTA